jgi:hypothetical protein
MDPALRVRRNSPYPGSIDDLCTWLRWRHPTDRYVGVELEINQALLAGKKRRSAHRLVAGERNPTLKPEGIGVNK